MGQQNSQMRFRFHTVSKLPLTLPLRAAMGPNPLPVLRGEGKFSALLLFPLSALAGRGLGPAPEAWEGEGLLQSMKWKKPLRKTKSGYCRVGNLGALSLHAKQLMTERFYERPHF